MKMIFIYCVLIAIMFSDATGYKRPLDESIVAFKQDLQSRTGKQERLILADIVAVGKNLKSRIGEKEHLIVDGIVAAKYNPKSRMNQNKLQSIVKA